MTPVPITEWTSYRSKYGLASGRNLYGFEGAGKSCLTPLAHQTDNNGWPFSMQEYEDYKNLEKIQRRILSGYTTAELIAGGAFPSAIKDEDLENFGGELTNEIHPVLDRKQWLRRDDEKLPKNLAFFMIGRGKEGYWDAWNDDVWEVLKPILRLATKLLCTVHLLPWFDATLQGDLQKFSGDFAKYKHFLKVKARNPDIAYENREATHRLIMQWGHKSQFHITHGGLSIPGTEIDSIFHGMTLPVEFKKKRYGIDCFPLAREFDKAEILMIRYTVATTIVHELCHALFSAREYDTPGLVNDQQREYEPYFENEAIQELGASMTSNMLGGYSIELVEQPHINYPKSYAPPLATRAIPWPSKLFADVKNMDDDSNGYYHDRKTEDTLTTWLVPAIFFHHIQQNGFWETHVDSYGAEALWPIWPMRSVSKQEGCEHPAVYHSIANIAVKDQDVQRACIARDIFQRAKYARIAIEYHLQKRGEDEDRAQQEPEPVLNREEVSNNSMECERATDKDNDDGFEEFIKMILTYRFGLALDTHKRVSEHVFLDYINRTCGRLVGRDDFRRYMRICNQRKLYFGLKTIPGGADINGIITVRDVRHFGYDVAPGLETSRTRSIFDPAPNTSAQVVPANAGLFELVKECIKRNGDEWGNKSHNWHDTDLDVLSILNYAISVRRIHRPDLPRPECIPVNDFSKFLLDNFGTHFARGPEGVIRWIYKPKSNKRKAPEEEEGSDDERPGQRRKTTEVENEK